jgi:hypothetical protein
MRRTIVLLSASLGATAAKLLGRKQKARDKLIGHVMTEAMPNGAMPAP